MSRPSQSTSSKPPTPKPTPKPQQQAIQQLALWVILFFILGLGGILYAVQRQWLPFFETAEQEPNPLLPPETVLKPGVGGVAAPESAIAPPAALPPNLFPFPIPSPIASPPTSTPSLGETGQAVSPTSLPTVLIPPATSPSTLPPQPTLLTSPPSPRQAETLPTVSATGTAPINPLSPQSLPPHPMAEALQRLSQESRQITPTPAFPAPQQSTIAPPVPGSPTVGAPYAVPSQGFQTSPPPGTTGYIVPQELRSPSPDQLSSEIIDPFADLEQTPQQETLPVPPPFSGPGRPIGNGELGTFLNPGIQNP